MRIAVNSGALFRGCGAPSLQYIIQYPYSYRYAFSTLHLLGYERLILPLALVPRPFLMLNTHVNKQWDGKQKRRALTARLAVEQTSRSLEDFERCQREIEAKLRAL